MNSLRLDYRRSQSSLPWLGIVLLVGAVGMAADLGIRYLWITQEAATLEPKLAASQQPRRASKSKDIKVSAQTEAEARQMEAVIQQLALPWDSLFKALEDTKSAKVALLAIEPDPKKGNLVIAAEAKNTSDVLRYIDKLQDEPMLRDVFLIQHQVQKQDPARPIRFQLSAAWVKAS